MEAIEAIREHSRRTLDSAAAAALLTCVPVDELCAAFASILGSNDEVAILDACLVIRDAATMAPGHPNRAAFLDALRQWRIVGQIEDLLIHDHHAVRGAAIYTLGKIGAAESVPALRRAFSVYREADPLLVPEVIGESAGLGADKWGLIDEALDSPVYATRWSTIVDLAQEASGPGERARQFARLDRLARDVNPLVSAEASSAYAALSGAARDLPSPGPTEGAAPRAIRLSFVLCATRFSNYLLQAGHRTYTVRELEAFIAGLAAALVDV